MSQARLAPIPMLQTVFARDFMQLERNFLKRNASTLGMSPTQVESYLETKTLCNIHSACLNINFTLAEYIGWLYTEYSKMCSSGGQV